MIEKRLVRVIISTNQNEHFIKVPDATVIFDSALTEVEYYDVNKSVTIFKTEQLPDHDINQRNALIEDNKRNVHFVFKVQNHRKIDKVVPFIRRCDLIKSILQLRSIDVDFEKQRNLPDEPVYDNVVNQMNNLKKLNLIKPKSGELTELGKQVSKFSFVSPYLAIATANFKKNQEFAFLVSLIIDKSIELIENSQAPLLCDHFCNESDVVTILYTILALNTNERSEIINENEVKYENSGISMSALELFYLAITNTFHKKNKAEGRESMINSIKWSKGQLGGTIAMIDEYINLLDKDKFLNIRKAAFNYIVGVGTISEPTIVYKANDVLKFDDDSSEDALVKFSKRPGCNGLQSPGNIIVLSFQIEEAIKLNRGFLLHRDLSAEEENLGVVSQEAKSFLNSCFFVALFEAYWNGNPMVSNLIPIYHSNNPKKDAGFLIHINECNKKTYISYCPKTQDVRDEMNRSISFLSSLMPYVPRSIVSKSDTPLCAVEIISYGTSEKYQSHVFLIDQPTKPKPIAYPLNKQLLEYAGSKIDELRKTNPKIRFSITGESIYYKFNGKRQVEADFSYPDVDPNIKSVFDPFHSSHLVLLIDQDYGNKPSVSPIPWISNSKADGDKMKQNENDETDMMIDISTKIINDLGSIRRSEDLFFITLNNGYPSVKKGEIPDFIQEQIGYDESDQRAIKLGIHQLIQQISKKLIDIWDDSYHKCEIDDQISNILISNSFPVTSVTHEPTVELIVYHLPRFGIQKEEFEQKVNEIADKFGFLNYFRPNYKVGGHDVETESRVLGEMVIGLLGQNCCIECATCISKQFPLFQGDEDLGIKLSITMTMSAMDTLQSLHEIYPHLGIVPKIGPVDKVIHVPECEIEAMKDLVKKNKQWRFNEDYRILIIKLDEEEEAKRKMQKVRQEKMNTTCFLSCGMDEPELLPQFLFVNEEDGTVKQIGICKKCAKDMFASYEDIQFVYNPDKHMIYLDRLKQLPMTIKGIQLIPQIENGKNEWWPQIPLGQLIWALISDPYDDLTSFVKAWFTIATEYAIQHSDYFMFCPDHPQIPIIRPGDNETVKCPVCDMIYCKDCNSWHKMDAECSEGFIRDEVKRCPKCHIPGIRYKGCDHMTCPSCDCQWNYQTCQKM